jgi:GNAT superfamily N-acetyltransferase
MVSDTIKLLTPAEALARRDGLVALLIDAVDHGASVNFIRPMTRTKARDWWDGALESQARGERLIFAAEAGDVVNGTVQLVLAPQENQAFRGDLAKMLVHSRARRRGLGEALLHAAEREARRIGRTLLTLDTETGSAGERLYTRLGWSRFGVVPGYATSPDGSRRDNCSFFYKTL